MKFVALFIAAVAAVKIESAPSSSPIYPGYFDDMNAKADAQHAGTMGQAGGLNSAQVAGVAASKADQCAYNQAHGCKCA